MSLSRLLALVADAAQFTATARRQPPVATMPADPFITTTAPTTEPRITTTATDPIFATTDPLITTDPICTATDPLTAEDRNSKTWKLNAKSRVHDRSTSHSLNPPGEKHRIHNSASAKNMTSLLMRSPGPLPPGLPGTSPGCRPYSSATSHTDDEEATDYDSDVDIETYKTKLDFTTHEYSLLDESKGLAEAATCNAPCPSEAQQQLRNICNPSNCPGKILRAPSSSGDSQCVFLQVLGILY